MEEQTRELIRINVSKERLALLTTHYGQDQEVYSGLQI